MRVRAFYHAFRRINDFDDLRVRLPRGYTRSMMERGWHFGDLVVQVHFGAEAHPKKKSAQPWTSGPVNSTLSLVTTFKGSEALNFKHHLSVGDKTTRKKEVLLSIPGSTVLSSPFAFQHAHVYPETSGYSDRIITVEARFLLDSDFEDDTDKVLPLISQWLENREIRLPTLQDVLEAEEQLATQTIPEQAERLNPELMRRLSLGISSFNLQSLNATKTVVKNADGTIRAIEGVVEEELSVQSGSDTDSVISFDKNQEVDFFTLLSLISFASLSLYTLTSLILDID